MDIKPCEIYYTNIIIIYYDILTTMNTLFSVYEMCSDLVSLENKLRIYYSHLNTTTVQLAKLR